MIRKDREITDVNEIIEVLKQCDTVSIAFHDNEYPYILPVSFGVVTGENTVIYFHGANRGKKIDLIESNPKVCVEGHIFREIVSSGHGITTKYESIIAYGSVVKVEGEEVITGLNSITEHYAYPDYPVGSCKELPYTAVYKVVISDITGKRNV